MYSQEYLRKNRILLPLLAKCTKPSSYDRFLKNAYAILGFDSRDELCGICCPTLILAGDDDKMVGKNAPYELNSAIAGSELHVYQGLGHGAFEEVRDFYDKVLEFCDRG